MDDRSTPFLARMKAQIVTPFEKALQNGLREAGSGLANPCEVCATPDQDKPMCFRGERWCSDNHRKIIQNNDK